MTIFFWHEAFVHAGSKSIDPLIISGQHEVECIMASIFALHLGKPSRLLLTSLAEVCLFQFH